MPETPEPPDDYSESERRAWRRGAVTALRLVGSQAMTLAGHLQTQSAPDADDESCPECGGDLVEAFGGAHCPDCGYVDDGDDGDDGDGDSDDSDGGNGSDDTSVETDTADEMTDDSHAAGSETGTETETDPE